jgi:SAM-dependent methyltransferase
VAKVTDATRFDALDAFYGAAIAAGGPHATKWLLAQTLADATQRRGLLDTIPLGGVERLIDVGTGLGPLALELAAPGAREVVGIDRDAKALDIARAAAAALDLGDAVRFIEADACELAHRLPVELPQWFASANPGADLAIVRLLLQHLGAPLEALRSVVATLRHGGMLWLFDVDDGLSVSWPPLCAPALELEAAFAAYQASYGGDREIGRRLPELCTACDLLVREVRVVPVVSYATSRPGDTDRAAALLRIHDVRAGLDATGVLSAARCDALLAAYAGEASVTRLRVESQVLVLAQRP